MSAIARPATAGPSGAAFVTSIRQPNCRGHDGLRRRHRRCVARPASHHAHGGVSADFMTPAIAPDEIVTGVNLTLWPPGHGSAFVEFSRRRGDFAIVSVAVLLQLDDDIVRRVSITVGGLSFAPTRVTEAEDRLLRVAGEGVFVQPPKPAVS